MGRSLPRKVGRGDVIAHELWNEMVDYLAASRNLVAGPGISLSLGDAATMISLAAQTRYVVPGIITKAYGASPDDTPANAKYDAHVLGNDSVKVTNKEPDIGRAVKNARIISAAVNSPCFFLIYPNGTDDPRLFFGILMGPAGEQYASKDCGTPGPEV